MLLLCTPPRSVTAACPAEDLSSLTDMYNPFQSQDPLTTLKIIFQLGDPRRGKADRKSFWWLFVWWFDNQRDIFALLHNIEHVPTYSCYRTLLDVLQITVSPVESPIGLEAVGQTSGHTENHI